MFNKDEIKGSWEGNTHHGRAIFIHSAIQLSVHPLNRLFDISGTLFSTLCTSSYFSCNTLRRASSPCCRQDSDGSDVKAEVRFKHRTPGSSETRLLHVCDLGPVTSTSWQIGGETVKTVADFIFLGSKITADGDCSHEIKRRLLLGRKV